MRGCFFAIATGILMLPPLLATLAACPTEDPASWVYPYLDEIRLRQGGYPFFVNTGPYQRVEIAHYLGGMAEEAWRGDPRSAWLYGMLRQEFAPEAGLFEAGSPDWTGDFTLRSSVETERMTQAQGLVRMGLYTRKGLCLWSSLNTTLNAPDAHSIQTHPWQDRYRASVEAAGVGFSRGGFSISLARDHLSWGVSRQRGLLFSGSAPSYDMLKMVLESKRLRFTCFHSQLRRGQDDGWEATVRRYLSAHRLDLKLGRALTVGISEAVIYGGEGGTFDLIYLNPLTVFYSEQWNSGRNDNIFVAGDFSVLMAGHAEVIGELVIDDFQYDFGTEPHELAAAVEITALNPMYPGRSLVGGSYYHVRNQTYGHMISWLRFMQEGKVMGYPQGPDGDRLELWTSLAWPEAFRWRIGYVLQRQGEGRASDPQGPRGPRVKFPSGVVETGHRISLDLSWRPCWAWLVEAGAEHYSEENAGNVLGEDRQGFDFRLSAGFAVKLPSPSRH